MLCFFLALISETSANDFVIIRHLRVHGPPQPRGLVMNFSQKIMLLMLFSSSVDQVLSLIIIGRSNQVVAYLIWR